MLLTGGDPLILSTRRLEQILGDVAAVPVEGACGIGQAVRAGARALVHAGRNGEQAFGLSDDQRAAVEIAVAEDPQVEDHARHGGRNHNVVDRDVT